MNKHDARSRWLLTIEELFAGQPPEILLVDPNAFKKAAVEARGEQGKLL
jgi:hypothetical protein